MAPDGPLSPLHGALSDSSVLQLIFDVKFLVTLLTGPAPASSSSVPTATASRKREIKKLEELLTGCIDPIDWATYETHLISNVGTFVQRSKILLGLAMRGGGAPTPDAQLGTRTAAVQPGESNLLRMATPICARFVYLPVNTPSAMRQRSVQKHVPVTAASLLDSGEACQYSFASLVSTQNTAGDQRAVAEAAAAAVTGSGGSAVVSSGMGAAALEALRQSTFGSILGDRAAEMGASLGDSFSSLSQGGTGLLSSLQLPSFKR